MQIKSVIIENIYYINFISFNINNLFFSWFAQQKYGCIFYAVQYNFDRYWFYDLKRKHSLWKVVAKVSSVFGESHIVNNIFLNTNFCIGRGLFNQ